ncbi:recombinase family protein [Flavobacterium plurextorum]|uniref:recombinase family protein n=1 Tax=Flavobacterium TaxID=237 RepID=UPI00214DC9CB|nr:MULTISPECIES: recombinase family protein [Flavobacterium]UUW11336.1 recombinase family protein [Flavobacterium plurextorum]
MATLGIYKRVSTDEQNIKGISLDNQESRGIELAHKLGWEYKIYSDVGLSGKISFDKRPGLNKLLNDVGEKKIKGIFVFDLDRLSRGDIIQVTLIKNLLKDNKTRLYDINGEIDLNDINQELLTDIRSLLNAFELKKISSRIKSVLQQNVQKGKIGGGPLLPFGYTKDENKKLVIESGEAEVVKYIYKLSLEGKGTKVIAGLLNDKNIPTKRTSSSKGYLKVRGEHKTIFLWRDAVVYRILTNTMYKGERNYKNEIYECPIIIEPLIFDLVQEKLKEKTHFKNTTNKYTYILKGLIYCSRCKRRLYGKKRANGRDNAYICSSQRHKGEYCGNVGINIDFVEDLVLKNILDLNKQVEVFFENIKNDDWHNRAVSSTIKKYSEQIRECNLSISNLIFMAEKANIDPAVFKSRIEQLNKKLEIISEKKRLKEKELGIINDEKVVKEFIRKSLLDFKKCTKDEIVDFVRNFIFKMYVQWDEDERAHYIAIHYKIDRLNNYQISRELLVNRTGMEKDRKKINRFIKEEIVIVNAVNFVPHTITRIRYTN